MFTSTKASFNVYIPRSDLPSGSTVARAPDSMGTGAGAGAGAGDDLPAEDAEAVEGCRCPNARCACAASGGQGQGQSPRSGRSDEGEVHVDVVSIDAGTSHRHRRGYHSSSRPPRFCSKLAPQLSGAPLPRTDFARLTLVSPYPGAACPRSAWFSVGVGGGVDVEAEEERGRGGKEDGTVAGVPGASPSAKADTLPPADVEPSRMCASSSPLRTHPRDADEPASPTPESELEEAEAPLESALRVLNEEAVSRPIPVESDVPPAPSEQAASPVTVQLWGAPHLFRPRLPPRQLLRANHALPPPSSLHLKER
ncbi:hypothetical protein DFH08DRAFT_1083488 [Mycena albidolilacea]|uniref:Uncharacterized protein n=1 Tax=Mycena albidolilacea TaxID=1033008 RepID=A0AAD7EK42_9AGAR|nr:hypothetical protein DFH08DRAFT_1083488 [Mycena albidolilacea]